jgi:hypothetical protein
MTSNGAHLGEQFARDIEDNAHAVPDFGHCWPPPPCRFESVKRHGQPRYIHTFSGEARLLGLTLFEFFDILAHKPCCLQRPSLGRARCHSQATMVGPENFFSKAQWPQNLQNRSQPTHKVSFVIAPIATAPPVSNPSKRLAEKRPHKLRAVHPVRPTTECGRIGYAIRVLKRRRRLFPGAVFYESTPERITSRQQAVMRIRERKQW